MNRLQNMNFLLSVAAERSANYRGVREINKAKTKQKNDFCIKCLFLSNFHYCHYFQSTVSTTINQRFFVHNPVSNWSGFGTQPLWVWVLSLSHSWPWGLNQMVDWKMYKPRSHVKPTSLQSCISYKKSLVRVLKLSVFLIWMWQRLQDNKFQYLSWEFSDCVRRIRKSITLKFLIGECFLMLLSCVA